MTTHTWLVTISVWFCVGILFGSVVHVPVLALWVLTAACGVCIGLCRRSVRYRRYLYAYIAGVSLLGFALGGLRVTYALQHESKIEMYIGQPQEFVGKVVVDPDVRESTQLVVVQPAGFTDRVLVTTTRATKFFYGDTVVVRGTLALAEPFNGFDYQGFLERQGVYAVMRYPKIIVLGHKRGASFLKIMAEVKQWLHDRVLERYDPQVGNIVLGILIGAKRGVPETVMEDFVATGTSHVLAVSGFNVTIFILWLGGLAGFIGRRYQLVVSALCIVCFVAIAGFSASVVRAALMGALVLGALGFGRVYRAPNAVLICAGCMLLQNPLLLYWDIGFQLSMAATLAIVLGMEIREGWVIGRQGEPSLVPSVFIGTLCAIIATAPLTVWHFGTFSLVALVVNMFVVPVIEVIMFLAILSLLPVVGLGFAFVTGLCVQYLLWCVHVGAAVPHASLPVLITGLGAGISLCVIFGAFSLVWWYVQKRRVLLGVKTSKN